MKLQYVSSMDYNRLFNVAKPYWSVGAVQSEKIKFKPNPKNFCLLQIIDVAERDG